MAGRPRKPTALKRLQGTFRPDRNGGNEPQPVGDIDPPSSLTAAARAEWDRLAPALEAVGLLTVADVAVFSVYVQAWADYNKISDQLNGMGSWTWESEKGYRQVVPEISMRKEAWTRVKEAGSRLGLDPSSRSGLNVTSKNGRAPNPFDMFDAPRNKFTRLGRRPA